MRRLILLFCLSFTSCGLLNMSPLTVDSWTPAESLVTDIGNIEVTVTFSREVKRHNAEQAFRLTAAGVPLTGSFEWIGEHTLRFLPADPLEEYLLYELSIATSCEDIYGNSLELPFTHTFSTTDDEIRPVVSGFSPGDHEYMDDRLRAITIEFTEAMDRASLIAGFSLSPSVDGSYGISPDGSTLTFTPYEYYAWQQEYVVTISPDVTDLSGNTLGSEVSFRFFVGTDSLPPEILSAGNGSGFFLTADSSGGRTVTTGWETDWDVAITFSEPVMTEGLASRFVFEPSMAFEITGGSVSSLQTAVLDVQDRFEYGAVYQLTIADDYEDRYGNPGTGEVYYFLVDGPGGVPPEVSRVTFLEDPASNPGSITDLYQPDGGGGYLTSATIDLAAYDNGINYKPGFFDVYLSLAEAGTQDIHLLRVSLIESFDITAGNNCADIIFLAVEPLPGNANPAPGADEIVFRFHVEMYSQVNSGLIEFSLDDDFKDSLDNPVSGPWKIRIPK